MKNAPLTKAEKAANVAAVNAWHVARARSIEDERANALPPRAAARARRRLAKRRKA